MVIQTKTPYTNNGIKNLTYLKNSGIIIVESEEKIVVHFKIKTINDELDTLKESGIVEGKTLSDAIKELLDWYDEKEIISLTLEPVDSVIYEGDMDYIFSEDKDNEESD